MKNFHFLLLIFTVLISGVWSIVADDCEKGTNKTCEECLKVGACSFCKKDKICYPQPSTTYDPPCPIGDLQVGTCFSKSNFLIETRVKTDFSF